MTTTRSTLAIAAAAAIVPVAIAAGYHTTGTTSAASATAPAQTGTAPGITNGSSNGSTDGGTAQGSQGSQGSGRYRPGPGWTTSRSAISGTPLASAKGVVLVATTLPGGEGAGTGITLSADGTVLTNYHVVEGATSIEVTDSTTGRSYDADVVGHDASHDVAVLRLEGAGGLSTAVINETLPAVGSTVTAVGQGGGRGILYAAQGTVTSTDEQITAGETRADAERLSGLIETTADVVPGYSGGPLLDTAGRVVGIDTAASSGPAIDGYAVPMSQAMSIARQIQAGTRSDTVHIGPRAALGVTVASGSQVQGAGVVEVSEGSAAADAGITAGSVVTAVDGAPVASASALTDALSDDYPGASVRITWTDPEGASHTRTVTLGTNPAA